MTRVSTASGPARAALSPRGALAPLLLILAARLALGLTYSLVVPAWESYDEDGHFAYARYLAKHRKLLEPGDPEAEQVWEKFQPPLYYLLIAPTLAWLDLRESFRGPERNPYFVNGDAGVNYALHPDRLEGEARQTAVAVHLARALGVVISTASVIFVALAARRVWAQEAVAAWAATLLYAFWPQYLFVGGMITNDLLVTAFSAAFFYLAILLATEGFRVRRTLLLGLVLVCAMLTKLNAIALIPVAIAAILMSLAAHPRAIDQKIPYPWLALLGLGGLLAASFWALSSLDFVTGQIFQARTVGEFLRYIPVIGQPSSSFVPSALSYGFHTFFASFGWGNLETYPWLYGIWASGAVLALAGLALIVARRAPAAQVGLFLLMLLQVASLVTLALALAIAQQDVFLVPGRYLLPALPAVCCLLIGGWRALISPALQPPIWKAASLGLVVVSWSIPFTSLAPAYAKPQPLRASAVVPDHPLSVVFGEAIELIGYQRSEAARPGSDAQIALCWQALAPVQQNFSVALEIVGPDGQGYGRLETYPGRGNYATSMWAVNSPFCDSYTLNVGRDIPAPAAAHWRVSLLNGVHGEALPVQRPGSGSSVERDVWIPVKVAAPRSAPSPANPVAYRFGDGILLRGYEIQALPAGDPRGVRISLQWEALADIEENYVVFVHLRDAPDHAYAQHDSPPRAGWYPTSFWEKGEVVVDEHVLYLPNDAAPASLDLYVGLYDGENRVAAFDHQGNRVLNDEVILGRRLSLP